MNKRYSSGSALIVVLLIVAICAGLSVVMLKQQWALLRVSSAVIERDAMRWAMQPVYAWADKVIQNDLDVRIIKNFHKRVQRMEVTGSITALGGRFNLNVLQKPEAMLRFGALLHAVCPDLSSQTVAELVIHLREWFVPGYGEDLRMAHPLMTDPSELRAVRGFNAVLYTRLRPYITAVPDDDTRVNVNYASAVVLASLADISLEEAQRCVQCRGRFFYHRAIDFIQTCCPGLRAQPFLLTVDNRYYSVNVEVHTSDHGLKAKRIMMREYARV